MSYASLATAQRARAVAADQLPAFALGLGVAPVLAVNGGFFSTSWGWATLGLAWAAILASLARTLAVPARAELVWVGGFAALTAWTALSYAWSQSPADTALEVERTLVYVGGALAVLAIVRRQDVETLLAGLTTGILVISAYALATRIFPTDLPAASYGGIRLSTPVGYWNGLGLVAVMGALLASTFAAKAESIVARALAGAAIPVAITTAYFTFSRGAWLALAIGLVVLVVLEPRRIQLVLTLLPLGAVSAVVVWQASTESALTHAGGTLGAATHEGHRVAAILVGACLLCGYAAVAMRGIERSRALPREVERRAPWVAVALVVIALAGVFATAGAPWTIARHAYHSFVSAPPAPGANLNNRLFSLSNNGRLAAWHVAWHAFASAPVAGIGAGGFDNYWNQHRKVTEVLTEAHSLYFETAAELGLVGLAILLATLGAPLTKLRRIGGTTLGAAAAFCAFLVAELAEWHWELTGVTLCALLCGGAILASQRGDEPVRRLRALPVAAAAVVALLALVTLGGNLLVSASNKALRHGDAHKALTDARRARTWAPWSADAAEALARAKNALGDKPGALAAMHDALKLDPRSSQRWLDLALMAKGAERRAALDRAQQLNPLDTSVAVIRKQLGVQ